VTEKQFKIFEAKYKNATSFDCMQKQDNETYIDAAERNIQWLRDWAEESAQGLERNLLEIVGIDAILNNRYSTKENV